jgi:hypothetical protein
MKIESLDSGYIVARNAVISICGMIGSVRE